jgi:S-DNA-T family DNA segregation ATPase FtsK/SpoIIIE
MEIEQFNKVLAGMKIAATCGSISNHGSFTFYDLILQPTCKVSKIRGLLTEIGLTLRCQPPVIIPIAKDGIVRLQTVTGQQRNIDFHSDYTAPNDGYLPFYFGEDPEGYAVETDMAENPHMLVSGATGSGKSIALHMLIGNAIYRNVDLFLSDPKGVEFSQYRDMRNTSAYTSTYSGTVEMVSDLIGIMDERYRLMSQIGVQSAQQSKVIKPLMLVIDEVADLIAVDEKKRLENLLGRLAQKSRASGIYIILATQRPSVGVINGLIKANFPARLCCKVASRVDSQIVLDEVGAEHLIGRGDAILKNYNNTFTRLQIAYTNAKLNLEIVGV